MCVVSYHCCRNSNVGIGVIVGSEMGVVEGLCGCSCRAAGKIRTGGVRPRGLSGGTAVGIDLG
jgi:hypothetical protein